MKLVISGLPVDDRLTKLFLTVPNILKGKSIVTEIVICPAYVLASSKQSEWTVGLRLRPHMSIRYSREL